MTINARVYMTTLVEGEGCVSRRATITPPVNRMPPAYYVDNEFLKAGGGEPPDFHRQQCERAALFVPARLPSRDTGVWGFCAVLTLRCRSDRRR